MDDYIPRQRDRADLRAGGEARLQRAWHGAQTAARTRLPRNDRRPPRRNHRPRSQIGARPPRRGGRTSSVGEDQPGLDAMTVPILAAKEPGRAVLVLDGKEPV